MKDIYDDVGIPVSEREQEQILEMFKNDCRELAGQFFDAERSEKWRVNFLDQDTFVEQEWKTYFASTRTAYANMLGPEGDAKHVSKDDRRRMYVAIVMLNRMEQENSARGIEADTRMQLFPNTQAFVGDRSENRKTVEKFGKTLSYRAAKRRWLNSIAGEI